MNLIAASATFRSDDVQGKIQGNQFNIPMVNAKKETKEPSKKQDIIHQLLTRISDLFGVLDMPPLWVIGALRLQGPQKKQLNVTFDINCVWPG